METKIEYAKVGDYYIPTLTIPDKRYNIGEYGMLRRTFLKEHHNAIYSFMLMDGTLLQHLEDVNKLCFDVLDRLIPAMAKKRRCNRNLEICRPNGMGAQNERNTQSCGRIYIKRLCLRRF